MKNKIFVDSLAFKNKQLAPGSIATNPLANRPAGAPCDQTTFLKDLFVSEHALRCAIESAIPCGIIVIDFSGRLMYVNRTFGEMTGWEQTDLIEKTYPYVFWPEAFRKGDESFHEAILSGEVSKEGVELLFFKKSGERFWAWVLQSPLVDAVGECIGYLLAVLDISRRKEAENLLRNMSIRLVDAQEKERRRVSQDLHDGIGGKLTGIKYSLEKILSDLQPEQQDLGSALIKVRRMVESTIEESQRISKNLHPSVLDDLGLLAAIRDFVHEYRLIYNHLKIDIDLKIEEDEISKPLKVLIYRIFQEAFTNAAKHSRCRCVSLTLEKKGDQVHLRVSDDGVGFEMEKIREKSRASGGMGLDNMKERTRMFNGLIDIKSEVGKGTWISAAWPLAGKPGR